MKENYAIVPIETLMEMPAEFICEMISRSNGNLKISVGNRFFAVSNFNREMTTPYTQKGLYGSESMRISANRNSGEVELYELREPEDNRQMHRITIELL